MVALPTWSELRNTGLQDIDQLLVWSALELRRFAIQENKQKIVRVAKELKQRQKGDGGGDYFGYLKMEVNLPYDSQIALTSGLNFVGAILPIAEGQAEINSYDCRESGTGGIANIIDEAFKDAERINSLERLLFWCCLVRRLSTPLDSQEISFRFIEEAGEGAEIQFALSLEYYYLKSLENNVVCAMQAGVGTYKYPVPKSQILTNEGGGDPPPPPPQDGSSSGTGNNSELGN